MFLRHKQCQNVSFSTFIFSPENISLLFTKMTVHPSCLLAYYTNLVVRSKHLPKHFFQALEEIGIWRNMRRFAGTSCGSVAAMLAALGYDSFEIEEILTVNLEKVICGK